LLSLSFAAPALAAGPAADLFQSKCAPCHGVDGLAATPAGKALKAASFKDPVVVNKPDADLIAIVKSGKGKMPAWTGKLTDDQIKALVTHIRTLQK
jgi:mono/diheme cytochrome c family protein